MENNVEYRFFSGAVIPENIAGMFALQSWPTMGIQDPAVFIAIADVRTSAEPMSRIRLSLPQGMVFITATLILEGAPMPGRHGMADLPTADVVVERRWKSDLRNWVASKLEEYAAEDAEKRKDSHVMDAREVRNSRHDLVAKLRLEPEFSNVAAFSYSSIDRFGKDIVVTAIFRPDRIKVESVRNPPAGAVMLAPFGAADDS